MCFSAEASFTVGSALCLIGALCLKKTGWSLRAPIAMIPFLFGIQQLSEGFVWLQMNGAIPQSAVAPFIFLLFAYVVWPIFVPIAFMCAETVPLRRRLMALCLLAGLLVGVNDLYLFVTQGISPIVTGNSIDYQRSSTLLQNIGYSLSTLGPIFLSSIPRMYRLGLALIAAYLLAEGIYTLTVTSVWCFFAACISLYLYFLLGSEKD